MTDMIFLDNPRRKKRRGKRRTVKRRPSKAQLRARRAFVNMVRGKLIRRPSKRRVARRKVRLGRKRFLMIPLKKQTPTTTRRNKVMTHRKRRHYRHNPVGGRLRSAGSSFTTNAKNSAIMALGIVVNGYISPMIKSVIPVNLGAFQPVVGAGIPIAVATFVKNPTIKLAAQAAAAIELTKLLNGVTGPAGVTPVAFTQPPQLPRAGVEGLGDGGTFSTVPYPLAE